MGMNTCDPRLTMVPGGLPLLVGGSVVGAIGAGGGTREQDMEIVLIHTSEIWACPLVMTMRASLVVVPLKE